MLCSLAQVSIKWFWGSVSGSTFSGVLCCPYTCFSRPSIVSHVVVWDTRYVPRHPLVASTMVSTWRLPWQLWENMTKSICQASPYLCFSHCKTRDALPTWPPTWPTPLALPSNPSPRSHRPGAPMGCYKPHTTDGLQPWSQGLGSHETITRERQSCTPHVPCPTTGQGFGTGLTETWHGAASGSLGGTTAIAMCFENIS